MSTTKEYDGSRRHILDWVESPGFLETARDWVRPHGLTISDDATWMPASWAKFGESRLFNSPSPFLSASQKDELTRWWLDYPVSANIPNWDLIISASVNGTPALVLVEAKAHTSEFDRKPKSLKKRIPEDAQARTDANHRKIGNAIAQASNALKLHHPGISISRDHCYQFSNRIAMAWKLATMGIPTALIFLGFTGDDAIEKKGIYFADEAHWQHAFANYTSKTFPHILLGQPISAGGSFFTVTSRSLPALRRSRPLSERQLG